MIVIDYKDSRPIYEQVAEKFQTLIVKGVLEPDSQMPSVRSLAMDLSINPNTIQKAYAELEIRQKVDQICIEAESVGVKRQKIADYILGKELSL